MVARYDIVPHPLNGKFVSARSADQGADDQGADEGTDQVALCAHPRVCLVSVAEFVSLRTRIALNVCT